MFKIIVLLVTALTLNGCVSMNHGSVSQHKNGETKLYSNTVSSNNTPNTYCVYCTANFIRNLSKTKIAIGDIINVTQEMNQYTNGGSAQLPSTLNHQASTIVTKLAPAVTLVERVDTKVFGYDQNLRKQAMAGRDRNIEKYYGGTTPTSDYYITGALTSSDFSLSSHGVDINVSGIGAKATKCVASIGLDLRIVNSKTLEVVESISLVKDYVGYRNGGSTFRFMGAELVGIDTGSMAYEAMGLGIKATLEEGVSKLVGALPQYSHIKNDIYGTFNTVKSLNNTVNWSDRSIQQPRVIAGERCPVKNVVYRKPIQAPKVVTPKKVKTFNLKEYVKLKPKPKAKPKKSVKSVVKKQKAKSCTNCEILGVVKDNNKKLDKIDERTQEIERQAKFLEKLLEEHDKKEGVVRGFIKRYVLDDD